MASSSSLHRRESSEYRSPIDLHKSRQPTLEIPSRGPEWPLWTATYQFYEMKQEEGEGIDAFITRLKTQATWCDFSDTDRCIKDQIVFRCTSRKVCRKALTEDLSLENLVKAARAEENALRQAVVIEKESGYGTEAHDNVNAFGVGRGQPGKYSSKLKHPSPQQFGQDKPNSCQYCGKAPSHL